MADRIVHIFGASGAGTSTLGRRLCETPGWFFMDTDDYFWLPDEPRFTKKRPRAERLQRMEADLARAENAVIAGSLTDWGDVLIPCFTLAVRLETDTALRLARLARREAARFGGRILPGGDLYDQHTAFLRWAAAYDTGGPGMRSRAMHDAWERLLPCRLLRLDGADDPAENAARVFAQLSDETSKDDRLS